MKPCKLRVATVSNKPARYFPNFLRSCERFNITPEVLHPGEEYNPITLGGKKWKLLHQLLCDRSVDFTHLLFVDSHDLVFLQGPEAIIEKFETFNCPFLISAESECWPYKELIQRHPTTPHPYRFVNSGGIIGEREVFIKVLKEMGVECMPDQGNDQGQMAIYFCENRDWIKLDSQGSIWTALHLSEFALEIKKDGVFNTLSQVYPSIVHGNNGTSLQHVVEFMQI